MKILNKLLGKISYDIGIDLGTANTLVYVKNRGIIINEPSVVAINKRTNQVLAIGTEAKKMVGKTPSHIVASRPLIDGVISDFEITEEMLKYFIDKVHKESFTVLPRPRVVIGIPANITEVEKRAVIEAATNSGAREAYLIDEPMAAAIGAKLPVQEAGGNMIIDIGGGTTEIAVISLGGIVVAESLKIAGDELNENIIQYARDEFNLLLGEKTAENIKIAIGSAYPLEKELEAPMRGRDLITGLPKEVIVNDTQIRTAISRSVKTLITSVKNIIEATPPELLADLMSKGILLTGGGALLKGLDQLIQEQTQIPVNIAEDPLTCVARGTGIVLEDLESLKEIFADPEKQKIPT